MNWWRVGMFVLIAVFALGVTFTTLLGTGISHAYFSDDFTRWTWMRQLGMAIVVYSPALLLAAFCYFRSKRETA